MGCKQWLVVQSRDACNEALLRTSVVTAACQHHSMGPPGSRRSCRWFACRRRKSTQYQNSSACYDLYSSVKQQVVLTGKKATDRYASRRLTVIFRMVIFALGEFPASAATARNLCWVMERAIIVCTVECPLCAKSLTHGILPKLAMH